MEIYLVGGAVRDKLLKRPIQERDWVVVGATVDDMLAQGFQPVGRHFPVFLHPKTHEEYALARTEKKISQGYRGFCFYTDPHITLEQDLLRRDLTINAMAETPDGRLIDPYGGQRDIKKQCLRHVSQAFIEDPVRILRTARFAATLPPFQVHQDTMALMQQMVEIGEVDALVAERLFLECQKALKQSMPWRFFRVLEACNALKKIMPELCLAHTNIQALKKVCLLTNHIATRFAALIHTLHPQALKQLCQRLKTPKAIEQLAYFVCENYSPHFDPSLTKPLNTLHLLQKLDAFRRPERFEQYLIAMQACNENPYPRQYLSRALAKIQTLDIQPLIAQGLKTQAFAHALKRLRLEVLSKHDTACDLR